MNYEDVMSTLKNMGTEQNRKIYMRHGASKNLYGVSFANLKNLQKNKSKSRFGATIMGYKKFRCVCFSNNDC